MSLGMLAFAIVFQDSNGIPCWVMIGELMGLRARVGCMEGRAKPGVGRWGDVGSMETWSGRGRQKVNGRSDWGRAARGEGKSGRHQRKGWIGVPAFYRTALHVYYGPTSFQTPQSHSDYREVLDVPDVEIEGAAQEEGEIEQDVVSLP